MAGHAVGPTLSNRIHALDFLRGIAILGILLANIAAFAEPAFAGPGPGPTGLGLWVQILTTSLVSGKFRSLLCILFGIGMSLYIWRRLDQPDAVRRYRLRYLALAAIGAFHGIFIWFGDILFIYGLAAIALVGLVKASTKTLATVAGLALATSLCLGVLMDLLMAFVPDSATDASFLDETAAYLHGSYADQVGLRLKALVLMLAQLPVIGFQIGGLMVLGILLAKTGVIADPNRHQRLVRTLLWVGAGGLALNLIPVVALALGYRLEMPLTVELGLAPAMSVGILAVGLLWANGSLATRVVGAVANVGRMALTSYLSQSVICTAVFYSWGGAQFGKLDEIQRLGVVAPVWLFNLAFAWLWLKAFRMGPVEWLWRRATAGGPLPMRLSDSVPVVAPPVQAEPLQLGPLADAQHRYGDERGI